MYRKLTEEKLSNLIRVSPTPYPFCIAWSITFLLINFISMWHEPYTYSNYFIINVILFFFITSIFAWCRRVLNINPYIKPLIYYIIFFIKSFDKYSYSNIHLHRNFTLREISYTDKSQLYEFSYLVKLNYITGFQSFLWSEFMIFFSLIWAYCHNAFSPSIWHGALWPPVYLTYFNWKGGPQYMTILLLSTSGFMNWADFTLRTKRNRVYTVSILTTLLIMGCHFIELQIWEYSISVMSWKDSIYSCTFYAVTAMHGLHVIVGMVFITFSLLRLIYDPYIRIEGFIFKKLFKKNLKKYFNINIIIRKHMQITAGLYTINNTIINKNYTINWTLFNSLFPNLFKPSYSIIQGNDNLIILYFKNLYYYIIVFILRKLNSFENGHKWEIILALWLITFIPGIYKLSYYKLKKSIIKSQFILYKHLVGTKFDILKVWEKFIYDFTNLIVKYIFINKNIKIFYFKALINIEFFYVKFIIYIFTPIYIFDVLYYHFLRNYSIFFINVIGELSYRNYLNTFCIVKLNNHVFNYYWVILQYFNWNIYSKFRLYKNINNYKILLLIINKLINNLNFLILNKVILWKSNKYFFALVRLNNFILFFLKNKNIINKYTTSSIKKIIFVQYLYTNYFICKYKLIKYFNLIFNYSKFYLLNNHALNGWCMFKFIFNKFIYKHQNYIILNSSIIFCLFILKSYLIFNFFFIKFVIFIIIINYFYFVTLLMYIVVIWYLLTLNSYKQNYIFYLNETYNANQDKFLNYNNLINSYSYNFTMNKVYYNMYDYFFSYNASLIFFYTLILILWTSNIFNLLMYNYSLYKFNFSYKIWLAYFDLNPYYSSLDYYINICYKALLLNRDNYIYFYINNYNYLFIIKILLFIFFLYWLIYCYIIILDFGDKKLFNLENLIKFASNFFTKEYMYFVILWNKLIYKFIYKFIIYKNLKKKYFVQWNWNKMTFSNSEWFIFFKVSAWYWHFVDVIWVLVYTICYIM